MDSARIASELQRDGYALVHDVIGGDAIDCLRAGLSNFSDGHARDGRTYAARNLLRVPAVAELARSRAVRCLVDSVLGLDAFAVRGLLFDKLPEANWGLPWHQDLSIAVRERREAPSFGPWSVKDGVTHVQPPEAIMAGMLAVRVHLDDADRSNGALRVVGGSHANGRLSAGAIATLVASGKAVSIDAPAGSALLMRPLLLHASSPAESPAHRRVIHLEYAAASLPNGLEWHERL